MWLSVRCAAAAPLVLLLSVACDPAQEAPEEELGKSSLIYGDDDRLEHYQLSDSALLDVSDSVAALMPSNMLTRSGSRWNIYTGTTLQGSQDVCSSEPYATQPTSAFCTGFVVGEDLIATAGHCVSTADCSSTRFVFGYRMDGANNVRSTVNADEVYSCQSVLSRENTGTRDYALVRVDRPITGRSPLPIRRAGTIGNNTALVLAGHPSGLPLKVAGGARVRANGNANYFEANVDSYGGNSGSPVFDAAGLTVEGILVRGENDYVRQGSCYVSNVCPDSGCPGHEGITRTTLFADDVPEINPSCADDALEDNDSEATATAVGSGTLMNLATCSGDDDWFSVDLATGQTLDVIATFSHAQGDLDMAVHAGGVRQDVSESVNDSEQISYTATAPTRVSVRVYGYLGAEADYDLDVSLGGTGLTVSGLAAVDAGSWYTFDLDGGSPGAKVYLVTGDPAGSTSLPRCNGPAVDFGPMTIVGSPTLDALGHAQVTVQIPSHLAGTSWSFQAAMPSRCEVSPLMQLSIQ